MINILMCGHRGIEYYTGDPVKGSFYAQAGRNHAVIDMRLLGFEDVKYNTPAPGTVGIQKSGGYVNLTYLPDQEPADNRRIVVILHDGEAGTFHGLFSKGFDPDKEDNSPMTGLIWEQASLSGGMDAYAAVLVLPQESFPIFRMTSGYQGRRGWLITQINADLSYESYSLNEFRAKKSGVEII